MPFIVSSVSREIAQKVRETHRSPQYGHPVAVDIATGYGPCRSCLKTFVRGEDRRILFTFNPFETGVPAPGPVYIHADTCEPFDPLTLPDETRALPLLFEPIAANGIPLDRHRVTADQIDELLEDLVGRDDVLSVLVRNAEAGCFIASVHRLETAKGTE